MIENLKPGDLTVMGDTLVEYTGEHDCAGGDIYSNGAHEYGCGYDFMANLDGMSLAERIAVVLDPCAALGTPEVIYRRNLGESMREAGDRLRAEVMQQAEDVLRVIEASK